MSIILRSSFEVEDIHVRNVFKVREEAAVILAEIEDRVMSGKLHIFLTASQQIEIEAAVESLDQKVVVVAAITTVLRLVEQARADPGKKQRKRKNGVKEILIEHAPNSDGIAQNPSHIHAVGNGRVSEEESLESEVEDSKM